MIGLKIPILRPVAEKKRAPLPYSGTALSFGKTRKIKE
jgi:hypothetical protein